MTAAPRLRASLRARVGALELELELDTGDGALVLVGPNGAGKTSVLSLLLGVLPTREGRIEIGDRVLLDTARAIDVPVEQRRIGYVPQDYALFPHLDVRGNVAFAVRSAASGRERDAARSASTEAARVDGVLRDLGITELATRAPATLSGGEQQRVALARALSIEPRALLLDEPLAALDVHARRAVRAFLADTLRTLALPTIIVTHDPLDARALGQRIAVIESGRITQHGRWDELVAAPATAFVRELLASAPALDQ
jgi:molybdate transport system ATP-binding protein